jgi:Raf kinase inhibitor-like YbhB/YbcL family protein
VLTIRSKAFAPGESIPAVHTCEGRDISPALEFSGAPAGTKSLALIAHDPDAPDPKAPKRDYVHWVLYNLPPDCGGIAEGAAQLPKGARSGLNDWKKQGYGGPCPPTGRHRYFFDLLALDVVLPDLGAPTRQQLEQAASGHVIEKASLMGTFQKTAK